MGSLTRIFGSSARLRLLRLFLLNQATPLTLAEAALRAKLSRSATLSALADLTAAGLLRKRRGKPLRYQINPRFEHLAALDVFIRQTSNLQNADVVRIVRKAGSLRLVVLSGFFTGALDPQIDLLVVGEHLNDRALASAVATLEAEIGREIRYAAFSTADFRYRMGVYDRLLRDVFDYPHRLLLAKIAL
ncbi:hypothetical protein HY091_03075 [Candidatus Kaiserbacteria bacterium]|nr:hypothetical protein [Candidatus Kaiserbacteria bacterium]